MKKITFVIAACLGFAFMASAQVEYKIITTVESIVPMGMGRSRMVEHQQPVDHKEFTTSRSSGKDSKSGGVSRGKAKIDALDETKLLNFYSGVGINMQNIASNDAMVSSKLNQMAADGWELAFVSSGVESQAGKDDNNGIFITRYVFKRMKK